VFGSTFQLLNTMPFWLLPLLLAGAGAAAGQAKTHHTAGTIEGGLLGGLGGFGLDSLVAPAAAAGDAAAAGAGTAAAANSIGVPASTVGSAWPSWVNSLIGSSASMDKVLGGSMAAMMANNLINPPKQVTYPGQGLQPMQMPQVQMPQDSLPSWAQQKQILGFS
jgi:hypothetical protein